MPRRRGGFGPGAGAMGGGRMRPPRPSTPFAGGMTGGATAPIGGPRAAPGALGVGGAGPGGGMPMAIKKGGSVEKHKEATHKKRERHEKLARGGGVEESARHEKHETREEERKEEHKKYARGGAVIAGHTTHGMPGREHPKKEGMHTGSDHKRGGGLPGFGAPAGPKYGTKGEDSRTHRPHSGKVS